MTAAVRFGRYRVDRPLGSGAFATVWLAHDEVLHAPVAVKLLADNWAHHLDVRERFLEEARILRRADSDRVVRVHDIGELDDGRPYFVMTYADRGSLDDVAARGPVPPGATAYYIAEAARGVAVLHRLGVVHRDLTPSNVLLHTVGSEQRVLIADLGLAKALALASGLTLTAGTPGYAAPEQAAGDGVDERTDVYALGAMAWRLVTGRPPAAVRPGGPALDWLPEVPVQLGDAVARAVQPQPAGRWPSAEEFAAALDPVAYRPNPAPVVADRAAVAAPDPAAGQATVAAPEPAAGTATAAPSDVAAGQATVAASDPAASQANVAAPEAAARPADAAGVDGRMPVPPGRRARRRRRRMVLAAAMLLVAAAAAVAASWWFAEPVTVRDSTRTLAVTVRASWSGEARGDTWRLDRYGLPGRTGVGIAVAPDLGAWSDTRSDVPGVFVGASRDLVAVGPNRVLQAATHPQCGRQDSRQYDGQRLTGTVIRWSDCSGTPITFSEAVLAPRTGGYLVVVQVKQAGDPDRTDEVLDSIQVAGLP